MTQRLNVPQNADEALMVKFHMEPVLDEAATLAAGGEPKWKNVEYLKIDAPGDRTQSFVGPVTDLHRTRFASRYEKWKRGQEGVVDGTPLTTWPGITPADVNMLAQAGVHSVEALASISDSHIGKVGRAVALRDKARRYLDTVRTTAPVEALEAKLQEERAKVTALSEKVDRLLAALETRQEATEGEPEATVPGDLQPRRGPGRPPKHPRPE